MACQDPRRTAVAPHVAWVSFGCCRRLEFSWAVSQDSVANHMSLAGVALALLLLLMASLLCYASTKWTSDSLHYATLRGRAESRATDTPTTLHYKGRVRV